MRKTLTVWQAAILAAVAASAALPCGAKPRSPALAPRRVALVVQNHTSDAPTLPMAAFADTLTARLSGKTLRVVNPHNVVGVNQNRTARGETMPEASAQEIGRMLGADGVVTASIQEFTGEDIHFEGKAVAHTLKVRLALNLADAATGETVCGVDGVELSKNYTAEKVKADTATLYEGLMHAAAAKGAEKLLAKVADSGWRPEAPKLLNVFFGSNVLGADVQIDGQSYGTLEYEAKLAELNKAQLELEKMKDDNRVEYEKKKLSLERERKALEAEQKERCALFKKQLELADAMLDRYELSGEADDYVRKTVAKGMAVYWKNSFGRIAITDGSADNIEFATPATDAADLAVPPNPKDIGEGLQKLLMKRIGR